MHVFVTGASGLIGSLLLRRLRARGDSVVALSRHPPGTGPTGVEWVTGDATQPGAWQARAAAAQGVVNLAGESIAAQRWTHARKQQLRSSRIQSTQTVVEALNGSSNAVLVTASAVGFYGPRGDEELDESAAPGTDFLSVLSQEWESAARVAETRGVQVTMLRFGAVLSPRGGALARIVPAFRWFVGGPIGDPNKWFPWIHEDDAVGLIMSALDKNLMGPVNAVAPQSVRMRDFARMLGEVLHRPSWLPVPELALRALLGELGRAIVPGQRIVPRAALATGYRFVHPELSAALAACVARGPNQKM